MQALTTASDQPRSKLTIFPTTPKQPAKTIRPNTHRNFTSRTTKLARQTTPQSEPSLYIPPRRVLGNGPQSVSDAFALALRSKARYTQHESDHSQYLPFKRSRREYFVPQRGATPNARPPPSSYLEISDTDIDMRSYAYSGADWVVFPEGEVTGLKN